MIPDSFKQDLLNRVDVVEVVSRYVQLKKAGANFQGLCPFHNEKTPSFSVSPAKQFYHCFGCGAHGNAIGFLMAYAGLGYVDAVKDLASSVGMQLPELRPRSPEEAARKEREPDLYAVMERAMDFYRAQLKKSQRAIDYLKGRGLTGEIAARFRIGYAPDGWQGLREAFAQYEDKTLVEVGLVIEGEGKRYDRFRDRVMFPIFNARGAVVGFGGRVLGEGEPKYLNSPETPLFAKGREIYGLVHAQEAIRDAGRVLVVEGYMDVVALAQYGVGYSVATLGTATTPDHVSKLLKRTEEIVFCFDGDAAGRKAAWRALEVSLPLVPDHKPFRFLFLPQGYDPDTFVRQHGKDAFEQEVRGAQTLSQFLLGCLRAETELETPEGRAKLLAIAKPFLQRVTAPALKLQLANEVAGLAKISDIGNLVDLPVTPYRRPAPARPHHAAPNYPEWLLLVGVLGNLSLVEHIDGRALNPSRLESQALIAIRDACREMEEPTLGALVDALGEKPWTAVFLKAYEYADSLNFGPEQATADFNEALRQLEVAHLGRELDALRGKGLTSKEDVIAFRDKNLIYKRLQGALPGPGPQAQG